MSIWGRLETQGRDAVLGGPSLRGSRRRAGPGSTSDPIPLQTFGVRRPELSLTGFKEASGLILWRVGNVPELMNMGGDRPQIIQSNSQCSPEEKLRLQVGKCPATGHPGKVAEPGSPGHLPSEQC